MIPLLLATGERNCLDPITISVAPALVPIANRPVMVYAVELLARQGYREIVVGLCEMAEQIELALGNGQRWNVDIQYLLQRRPLGLVDLLTRAASSLTDTCLILPGDSLTNFDIQAALNFHRTHGGPVTVLLYPASQPTDRSLFAIDSDHRLHRQHAGNTGSYCNTRIYLVEPALINQLTAAQRSQNSDAFLLSLLDAEITIHGYVLPGYWNPLASFADYQAAQQDVLAGLMVTDRAEVSPTEKHSLLEHHYLAAREIKPGVWCGSGTWIHPTIALTAPVIIGPGCHIAQHVELGPNVVIGANCVIDEGATLKESTILPATYIGRLLHIEQRVVQEQLLVDAESGGYVYVADPLLLGTVDTTAPSTIIWHCVERLVALLLLIGLLPLLLLISALLWLINGFPVLQHVQRIGRKPTVRRTEPQAKLEILDLWQLRTRHEDGSYLCLGEWLETWEFHRLPQLWNVLRGNLALVGVMPLTDEAAAHITEPWQQKRYTWRAGFTGPWYTEQFTPGDFDELCVVEAYHVATHNWKRDLHCLCQTPVAWLRRINERAGDSRSEWKEKPQVSYKRYAQLIDIKMGKPTPGDGACQ